MYLGGKGRGKASIFPEDGPSRPGVSQVDFLVSPSRLSMLQGAMRLPGILSCLLDFSGGMGLGVWCDPHVGITG